MGALLGILSTIAVFLSIVALARGRLWLLKSRKQAAFALIGSFVIFIVAVAVTPSSPTPAAMPRAQSDAQTKPSEPTPPATNTAKSNVAASAPAYPTEGHKQAFRVWYDRVTTQASIADAASKKAGEAVVSLAAGKTDRFSVYSIVRASKEQVANAWNELYSMKVPGLSKEHSKLLREASDDLATAQFTRGQGLQKLLEFLDSPKPSLLDEATRDFNLANSLMTQSVAKIVTVQADLGIKPEETTP